MKNYFVIFCFGKSTHQRESVVWAVLTIVMVDSKSSRVTCCRRVCVCVCVQHNTAQSSSDDNLQTNINHSCDGVWWSGSEWQLMLVWMWLNHSCAVWVVECAMSWRRRLWRCSPSEDTARESHLTSSRAMIQTSLVREIAAGCRTQVRLMHTRLVPPTTASLHSPTLSQPASHLQEATRHRATDWRVPFHYTDRQTDRLCIYTQRTDMIMIH